MGLVVESNSTTTFGERSTLTLNKPSGTTDGDLLIAAIAAEPGGGGTVNSVPTGWTLAKQETTDGVTYLYYKIASSEGASWNWGFSASNVCAGGVLRVSGADTSDPFDVAASEKVSDDATPAFTSADISPTTTYSLFVMVAHTNDTSARTTSAYAIVTSNPSWTEQFDFNESVSSLNQSFAVATAVRPEATASGDVSYTIDSGAAGADGRVILANFNVEPDVTVSLSPIIATATLPNITVTGDANVTLTPIISTATLPNTTITLTNSKWNNQDKSNTNPTISNTSKS